jgi:glycerol-3-phosphate dehydrogenase (NAD(P)+)
MNTQIPLHSISILGAGAWGTALAQRLKNPVILWSRNPNVLESIQQTQINSLYLPNIPLKKEGLTITDDLNQAINHDTKIIVIATPLNQLDGILQQIKDRLNQLNIDINKNKINKDNKDNKDNMESTESTGNTDNINHKIPYIICLSKGLNQSHQELPFETFIRIFSNKYSNYFYDLIGPSFAQEVAIGKPLALELVGCKNEIMKEELLPLLAMEHCRLYVNEDRIGAEMAVAIKNVLAIATGICDGLNLGDNARAGLITRGLQEMIRLIDCKKQNYHNLLEQQDNNHQTLQTVLGLSGIGDVLLTCTGGLSRNRQTGLLLAQGKKLDDILSMLGHVAEGVHTTKSAYQFAKKHQLDVPILKVIHDILYENLSPELAVSLLFQRPLAY